MTTAEYSRQEFAEAYRLLDIEQWAVRVAKLRLPKSGRIDFKQHPYLRELLSDIHPEIVMMKGAQMGMSTAAMIRSFWFLTTFPSVVIYTMPSVPDVQQYTGSRINPLIQSSEYLNARIVHLNSVMQKQFAVAPGQAGNFRLQTGLPRSTIHFRGAMGDKDTVAIDADMLVHDEEDLSNPHAIEQYESRLDHSAWKWRFRLSTPRLPGAGIDRIFKTTDQRRWFVKCSGCGLEFELAISGGPWDYNNVEPDTYQEVLDGTRARYFCHKCGKTITDQQRLDGRWVPTVAGADSKPHGYAISQLSAVWVPAERVLERKAKATWEQDFWNLVIGIPWQSEQFGFDREALLALTDADRPVMTLPSGDDIVFMGVDPGGVHDWVMQRMTPSGPQVIGMGHAGSWAELENIYRRWRPVLTVVDGQYDPTKASEFAATFNVPGRIFIWLAFATIRDNRGRDLYEFKEVPEPGHDPIVSYAPHSVQTATADELAATPRMLPRFDATPSYERFISHMVNSQKVPIWVKGLEADRVVDHYEWHSVGEDHQFSAMMYCWLARQKSTTIGVPVTGVKSFTRGREVGQVPSMPAMVRGVRRKR